MRHFVLDLLLVDARRSDRSELRDMFVAVMPSDDERWTPRIVELNPFAEFAGCVRVGSHFNRYNIIRNSYQATECSHGSLRNHC